MTKPASKETYAPEVPEPVISRRGFVGLTVKAALVAVGPSLVSGDQYVDSPWKRVALTEGQPTQEQLNQTIRRGDKYIQGLLKPLGSETVISEYYALPVGIKDERGRLHLPGRKGDGVEVIDATSGYDTERHILAWAGREVEVSVDWNPGRPDYRVSLTNLRSPKSGAWSVGMHGTKVEDFTQKNVGETHTLTLPKGHYAPLQSLRYTYRHGVQSGLYWALSKGDVELASHLRKGLEAQGFKPGLDLHAPIWGGGTEYPDNFVQSGDVYHDCDILPITAERSYSYDSKACAMIGLYRELAKSDTLPPIITALHILNKYGDPTKRPDGGGESPIQVAESMLALFKKRGESGISMSALGMHSDQISGLRTAHFGALMAELGYRYGIEEFQRVADRVAQLLLRQQIKDDGVINRKDGLFYRPTAIGGFEMTWDRELRSVDPPLYYKAIGYLLGSQREYGGIVPTNAETTLSALAFFDRYNKVRKLAATQIYLG